MKLGIVIGHNSMAQGAVRPDTGESEFQFNSRVAQHMRGLALNDPTPFAYPAIRIFERQAGLPYPKQIRKVYDETDAWGADLTMELHFNAVASPHASGTEMFSSGSRLSLLAAHELQEAVVAVLGLPDRGVKKRTPDARGGLSLYAGVAPAVLCEPFFASSAAGRSAVDTDQEEKALARAYLVGAAAALRQFPGSNLREAPSPKVRNDQLDRIERETERRGVFARVMRGLGFVRVEDVR